MVQTLLCSFINIQGDKNTSADKKSEINLPLTLRKWLEVYQVLC